MRSQHNYRAAPVAARLAVQLGVGVWRVPGAGGGGDCGVYGGETCEVGSYDVDTDSEGEGEDEGAGGCGEESVVE